ncbi:MULTISPECIES: hypothetical protein [unclassified Gilliamella]|nr:MULTISPECIES: hypothetical protein [unclassified Gilliamella]
MIKLAQFYSLDREETSDFIYLIKGMDIENMAKIEEKLKKGKK